MVSDEFDVKNIKSNTQNVVGKSCIKLVLKVV